MTMKLTITDDPKATGCGHVSLLAGLAREFGAVGVECGAPAEWAAIQRIKWDNVVFRCAEHASDFNASDMIRDYGISDVAWAIVLASEVLPAQQWLLAAQIIRQMAPMEIFTPMQHAHIHRIIMQQFGGGKP